MTNNSRDVAKDNICIFKVEYETGGSLEKSGGYAVVLRLTPFLLREQLIRLCNSFTLLIEKFTLPRII